jgi:hypothetical protein
MRASLSGGSLSVEPGSRRADPAFEQSECFESDGRVFANEATGYALLGPKIVKLVVVRSDDINPTAKRPPKVLGKVDGEARLR